MESTTTTATAAATTAAGSASVDTDASCGETMLDLYTGIGYFSMPALVHTNVAHIHMAEWNPHAVEAIRRNVVANRIAPQRYSIYAGDNRELRHVSHETNNSHQS
jgi:tRNA G37 N-methylase Trm5